MWRTKYVWYSLSSARTPEEFVAAYWRCVDVVLGRRLP